MNTVQLVKAGNKIKLQGLLYHYFEGSERATLLYDYCFIIENYLSEKSTNYMTFNHISGCHKMLQSIRSKYTSAYQEHHIKSWKCIFLKLNRLRVFN